MVSTIGSPHAVVLDPVQQLGETSGSTIGHYWARRISNQLFTLPMLDNLIAKRSDRRDGD